MMIRGVQIKCLPQLLNVYMRTTQTAISARRDHNDCNPDSSLQKSNFPSQVSKIKSKHPSSVFQLPIIDSAVPSPTISQQHDPLEDNIRSVNSLKELFELVQQQKFYEENHLNLIFRMLHQFQSNRKTCYAPQMLHNHAGFIELCRQLQKAAPHMRDPTHLVVCLKTLTFCHIAPGSRIIQTLLHLIKTKINDLDLQQIVFLHYLLQKLKCPLTDAMTIALPIVFQAHLETKLDPDNKKNLCGYLRYAVEHNMQNSKIMFIAEKLLSNNSEWGTDQVYSVIRSLGQARYLYDCDLSSLSMNVLTLATKLVDYFEARQLEKIVVTIGENYSHRNRHHWYNEDLCMRVAQRIVRERFPLSPTSKIGRTFSKISYVSFEFLDYYSSLIVGSNEQLEMHPHYVLAPFAVANYKPHDFNEMVNKLLQYFPQDMDVDKDQLWLRFAVDCASLGFYPSSLISHLFRESFLNENFGKKASDLDWLQLDVLLRSVRIECAEYNGPYPSSSFSEQIHRKIYEAHKQTTKVVSLENALQTGIGGVPYVVSTAMTKYGHFVDHIIAMRPGGYPVAINASTPDSEAIPYIENLKISSDCQLILIKLLKPTAYVANGERLRGVYDLDIRTLERAGYDVVSINLTKWESLMDYEKIPFLMQQIRLKEKTCSS